MKLINGLILTAAFFANQSFANTIDLGVARDYNVFVFGNYESNNWNSISGAVAVGGNANISTSTISNSAKNSYGLVVGGNLTKSYGNVTGTTWVGGSVTKPQYDYYNSYSTAATSPIDFVSAKTQLNALSDNLAATASTGSVSYNYGTNGYLSGTGSSVEYFTLSGSDLSNINNWSFSNIASGSTLILNVSGSSVNLTGGWSAFSAYNVLFNFYDATSLTLNNINFSASILATDATIYGSSGNVTGTVVANNWNNSLTLGNSKFSSVAVTTPVPEPHNYALLMMGLIVILGFRARKIN
ncbi:choice-of-anchor A family protein [Methylophilus sp. DW102]|jgi:choice-of-anchor A domain-containing protein|uniref:choice-of-anchor A family protein n=1 Tax=Methylophilus sp. DW102 TaxID=3095607 RepID=UPI003088CC6E|nr:choice-of-anchor A family protein [Methylophilus sp. DW102]